MASKDDKTTPRLNTVTHPDDVSPRSRALNESEFKQVTDKLRISEQRNAEYRNQVQGLKTEIKMAQKVGVGLYTRTTYFLILLFYSLGDFWLTDYLFGHIKINLQLTLPK